MKRLFFLFVVSFMVLVTMAQTSDNDAFYGGPYIMRQQVEVPASCTRVVVWSNPLMTGGSILIKNLETGDITSLYASVTYIKDVWYFIVPSGSYEIVKMPSNYVVHVNAEIVGVGSVVKFLHANGGYVLFEPK